ncbi:hypothetical protein E0Z10_g4578 [Xylaria hypoxylon]|uniref:Uncharacterized protein n=1 Tax=Xylaria hypoxylon TaxID=37992 RepID=A0A4Z0YKS4_9PEZI|nr:hypothetical protein E0Z10_g4578 [Xylaria hypoxylon]
MGFFDSWGDGGSVVSRKSHKSHKSSSHKHKREKSRSRSHSRERRSKRHSSSGGGLGDLLGDDYSKHNASRGSFFNLGNSSTRSFFSMAIQRMMGLAAKTAGGTGTVGLMGEAVRMATGLGNNSSTNRGYDGGLHYEKRRTEYTDYSGGSGGGGGFLGGIGKFFS